MGSNLHLRTLDNLIKLINAKTEVHRSYKELIKDLDEIVTAKEKMLMDRLIQSIEEGNIRVSESRAHPRRVHNELQANKAERQKLIQAQEKIREERTDFCNEFRQVVALKNLDSFEMKAALQKRTDYFGHLGNPYAVQELDQ